MYTLGITTRDEAHSRSDLILDIDTFKKFIFLGATSPDENESYAHGGIEDVTVKEMNALSFSVSDEPKVIQALWKKNGIELCLTDEQLYNYIALSTNDENVDRNNTANWAFIINEANKIEGVAVSPPDGADRIVFATKLASKVSGVECSQEHMVEVPVAETAILNNQKIMHVASLEEAALSRDGAVLDLDGLKNFILLGARSRHDANNTAWDGAAEQLTLSVKKSESGNNFLEAVWKKNGVMICMNDTYINDYIEYAIEEIDGGKVHLDILVRRPVDSEPPELIGARLVSEDEHSIVLAIQLAKKLESILPDRSDASLFVKPAEAALALSS